MKGDRKNCDQCNHFFIKQVNDHRFCGKKCRRKWHKVNGKHALPSFITGKEKKGMDLNSNSPGIYASPYLAYTNNAILYALGGAAISGLALQNLPVSLISGFVGYLVGKDKDDSLRPSIDQRNNEIRTLEIKNKIQREAQIERLEQPNTTIKANGTNYNYIRANEIKGTGNSYELDSKWRYFLGYLPHGFNAIIHGLPKAGKTHLSIQFAQYLEGKYGGVLYISAEEGTEKPFKEKLERYNANFGVIYNLKSNAVYEMIKKEKPKFVFIDSLNRLGLDVSDVRNLKELFPNICFFYVVQSTKAGDFRGSQELSHEVTAIIKVDTGIAYQKGRTVAEPTELKIFKNLNSIQ